MRLIDADKYIKKLNNHKEIAQNGIVGQFVKGMINGIDFAITYAKTAPTIEARKHGHWVRTDRYWWECSVCGGKNWIGRLREADSCKTPYCPHCGAIMDEEV